MSTQVFVVSLYERGSRIAGDCIPDFFATRQEAAEEAPRWLADSGFPQSLNWAHRYTIEVAEWL